MGMVDTPVEHVRILSAVINLMAGVWIAYAIHQCRVRFALPVLMPLFRLVVFFNLEILLLLFAKYTELNLLPSLSMPVLTAFRLLALTLVYAFGWGMISSVLAIARVLHGSVRPLRTSIWVGLVFILAAAGNCLRLLLSQRGTLPGWIEAIHILAIMGVLAMEFGIPVHMIRWGRRQKLNDLGRLSLAFGALYLSRWGATLIVYLILGVIFWWTIPEVIHPFFAFGILIYMNLIPFVWLKRFLIPFAENAQVQDNRETVLRQIVEMYQISPREKDVLELILEGKSNKEIEEALFISYHTVKNHAYNLFRKLGVKTRYELMHLASQVENQI